MKSKTQDERHIASLAKTKSRQAAGRVAMADYKRTHDEAIARLAELRKQRLSGADRQS
jgi:hypothetical protein